MISIITKSSNRSGTEVYRLMVDSEADLLNIKFYCAPGSKAFTPDMGSMWVMGPNGKWTQTEDNDGDDAGQPAGGEAGQVLTKTEEGAAWTTPESGLPEGGEPYKALVTDGNGETVWEDRLAWKESGTILDERIPETTIDFANATFAEGYYVNDPIGSDNLMATDFNTTEPIIVCWDGNYYQFYQAGMSGSGSGATWTFKTEATDEVFFVLITDGTIVVASTDNGVHTFRLGFGGTTSSVHTIAPEYIGGWDNVGSKGYVSLVKKQTVTIENDNGFVKLDGSIPAENAGKKCIVRIDDSPYECDVLYLAEWNATVIGNLSFADGSANDSGEPFCIAYNEADGTEMMTKLEAGEYTVEVVVAGVEKIPAKYLPDNIGGGVIVFDTEANNTIEDVKNLVNAYNEGKAVVIRAVWMGTQDMGNVRPAFVKYTTSTDDDGRLVQWNFAFTFFSEPGLLLKFEKGGYAQELEGNAEEVVPFESVQWQYGGYDLSSLEMYFGE